MPGKVLVIDANILVRAVLGKRVRELLETYCEVATFFVPEPPSPKPKSICQNLS